MARLCLFQFPSMRLKMETICIDTSHKIVVYRISSVDKFITKRYNLVKKYKTYKLLFYGISKYWSMTEIFFLVLISMQRYPVFITLVISNIDLDLWASKHVNPYQREREMGELKCIVIFSRILWRYTCPRVNSVCVHALSSRIHTIQCAILPI